VEGCDGTSNSEKKDCPFTVNGTNTDAGVHSVNNKNAALVVQMLASKVGSINNNGEVSSGFCAGVMRQCQRYTYTRQAGDDAAGKYNPNNEVVKNYLYQALPKIMAAQNRFIADYQVSCVNDLQSCYQRQLASLGGGGWYGNSVTVSSGLLRTMMSACDSIGLSCAFAVYNDKDNFAATPDGSNSCGRSPDDTVLGSYASSKSPKPQQCLRNISLAPIQGLVTCAPNVTTSGTPAVTTTTQTKIFNLCATGQENICLPGNSNASVTCAPANCVNNICASGGIY
jgi:hypothetical protein